MSYWPRRPRAPWWFAVLLILLVLPTIALVEAASYVIDSAGWLGGATYMGWLYPAYVVLSCVCAWICYPDRRAIAWILVALLALADLGLFIIS